MAIPPSKSDLLANTGAAVQPAPFNPTKRTTLEKKELSRIDAEYARREHGLLADTNIAWLGAQAIHHMHQYSYDQAVPTIVRMVEVAEQYKDHPAYEPLQQLTNKSGALYVQHLHEHLGQFARVVTGLTGQGFDLKEDPRGPIARFFEGDRR